MKYGLPYKGSKNKLAERIVSLLPDGDHLIDLFCGGCAVSHAALLRRKWPHVHINDIDWRPVTLFQDALSGKYQDEDRWISREDFQRMKDTDPYVAIVWSFGNNMRDYLYSQDIEPLKRAIHYAMFYGDYEPAREMGHDLSFISPLHDLQKRYLAVKHYFSRLGHFQQESYERGGQELDCSPGVSREIQLQSWNMGGQNTPHWTVKRPAALGPNGDACYQRDARTATPRMSEPSGAVQKKKEPERLQSHEQRRDLLQIAVQGASPLAARCGGGRNRYSQRRWATISRSAYPTARSSTATSPTRARMFTTSRWPSTTTASTTGAHGRRSRSSSAVTRCPTTASAASKSSRIAAPCRHRPTTRSRSASSSLGIRHRHAGMCKVVCSE